MIISWHKKKETTKYRHIKFFWVHINQKFHFDGMELIKVDNLLATEIKSGDNLTFSSYDDVIIEE